MRSSNKLSAVAVSKMVKPGCYADGLGLYLQVMPTGSKSWLFRFMRDGRARKMGLGPTHTVTLAMAREKALECRRKLLDGIDPIDQRQEATAARKVETAKGITFREAAEKYIAAHRAGWRNDKHARQWTATLATYAFPVFGSLPVAAVDVGLILKVLEPIWTAKAETANRLRGRIESVLDWATARHYRSGANPAAWRGHLENLLPALAKVKKTEHHPALPYAQIGKFMGELRRVDGIPARALEFAVLTAARSNEVRGARWEEIDLSGKMWTVPASRMKGGREHRVALSEAAISLLSALPRIEDNPYVFPGVKRGYPISDAALRVAMRAMGWGEPTVHGMRSCFRDWAAETTAYPNEMVEMALAHAIGNKAEAAYRRGDMLEKRARLMADWAKFCSMPARTGDVVPIRDPSHA